MKNVFLSLTALFTAVSFVTAAPDAKPEGEKKDKPKMDPEAMYKKLDADSNGSVSLDEFKAHGIGKKDPAKAEEIFKKKDKDADGKLSLDEFKAGGGKKPDGGKKPEGDKKPDAEKKEGEAKKEKAEK
jgi:Ca2+-binding EF-hand superfamily protein